MKMNDRCASVARKMVIASGRNVFDDYFTFYQDGRWLVEVVRRIVSTLAKVKEKPSVAVIVMPKINECVGYASDMNISEMGTESAKQQLKTFAKKLEDAAGMGQGEAATAAIVKAANEFHAYAVSYESSCVNVIRNRYVDDESNVSGLLDTIREAGNYVMNGRK